MLSRSLKLGLVISSLFFSGCITDNGGTITPQPEPTPIGAALDTENPILKVYGKNNQYLILHFNEDGNVCIYDANGKFLEETGDRSIGGLPVYVRDKYFDGDSNIKLEFFVSSGKYDSFKDAPEKHNTQLTINKEVVIASELNVITEKKKEITYEEAMEEIMEEIRKNSGSRLKEEQERENLMRAREKLHELMMQGKSMQEIELKIAP